MDELKEDADEMAEKKVPSPPAERPMPDRWDRLATYNEECARGIVHTPEWDQRMAVLQGRFDEEVAEDAKWEAQSYASRRRNEIGLR